MIARGIFAGLLDELARERARANAAEARLSEAQRMIIAAETAAASLAARTMRESSGRPTTTWYRASAEWAAYRLIRERLQ